MKISNMHGLPALRVALLTLCSTALAAPMLAQESPSSPPSQESGGPRPGRGGGERQLEMMTRRLDLTPDQVTQIKAIQTEGRTRMMALRDDTTIPQDDKHNKMMTMRQDEQGKIRGVLNDDQKTKYDAMLKQMQERRANAGNEPPPPPSLN